MNWALLLSFGTLIFSENSYSLCVRPEESLDSFLKSHLRLSRQVRSESLTRKGARKWEDLAPKLLFKKDFAFELHPARRNFPKGERGYILEKDKLENGCEMSIKLDLDLYIYPIHRPATVKKGYMMSYTSEFIDMSLSYTMDEHHYFLKISDRVLGVIVNFEAKPPCSPEDSVNFFKKNGIIWERSFSDKSSKECASRERIIIGQKN